MKECLDCASADGWLGERLTVEQSALVAVQVMRAKARRAAVFSKLSSWNKTLRQNN